ncbi:unnamed protein product [Prorocentrum cordatum]|uniref:Uncharacterized protein n=1 Tax=Prorocentrum cordatum TaxID=2364126 RepID=A0ABN9PH74_9DINO|nr:unnamed protein product [Polarella glacialis]
MANTQNQCKQLLAENKKLKKAQSQQAAGNMGIDEDEDGDNVAASSTEAQRKELQAKISKYEQQISAAKYDLQSFQQKLEQGSKHLDEKKDFLEGKLAEEKLLKKEVAGPNLLQFYITFASNPLRAKMQDVCRQNIEAKLAKEVEFSTDLARRRIPVATGLDGRRSDSAEATKPGEIDRACFAGAYNANQGKQTLKKRLSCTRSLTALAQVIGHHDWECEALSPWASSNMWNVMFVRGAPTSGGQPSAGLAIFAREGVGLRGPTYPADSPAARRSSMNEAIPFGSELVPYRAQRAVGEVPGWPPMNIFNIDLPTGGGMSLKNAKIPMNVGLAMAGQQRPSIVGGGWNMTAADVEASSFTIHAQVSLLAPESITCRAATANSMIDVFALSSGAMRLVKAVNADMKWAIKPRRPVMAEMTTMGDQLAHLTYIGGDKIQASKAIGPMLDDDYDWESERSYAEGAVELATSGPVGSALRLLSTAWAKFAMQAATRLGHLTGSRMRSHSYGGKLGPRWVTYAYEGKEPEGAQAIADCWKWYEDALMAISNLTEQRLSGDERKLQDEVYGFISSDFSGQGLSQRLDAVVAQARRALAMASTSSQDVHNVLEESAEDTGLEKQAADRDSAQRWKQWCDAASENGAGRFIKSRRTRMCRHRQSSKELLANFNHTLFAELKMLKTHQNVEVIDGKRKDWIVPQTAHVDGYANATGGHRIIILYSSSYRAWQRARRGEFAQLQDHEAREYWGAAAGRSAIDSAWKLSACAEACVSKFRRASTLIADYILYYETTGLAQARDKLLRLGGKMAQIKLEKEFRATAAKLKATINDKLAAVSSSDDISKKTAEGPMVTPIMLETLTVQGLARQHELALGAKWHEDPSMRVSFDFVAPYITSRKFNKYQKFCIMSCTCEGVWTRAKARSKRYITDGKCKCGELDTLAHRLAECTSETEFAIYGSCSKPVLLELQEAGWATVLMDPLSDEPLRDMYAAVPASLPQTSAMAEYLAFAFSCQTVDRPTILHADFNGTINQFKKSAQERAMVTQRYGGVFGFAQSLPGLEHINQGTPTFLNDYIAMPLGHRLVAVNQKGDLSNMSCKATVFVCIRMYFTYRGKGVLSRQGTGECQQCLDPASGEFDDGYEGETKVQPESENSQEVQICTDSGLVVHEVGNVLNFSDFGARLPSLVAATERGVRRSELSHRSKGRAHGPSRGPGPAGRALLALRESPRPRLGPMRPRLPLLLCAWGAPHLRRGGAQEQAREDEPWLLGGSDGSVLFQPALCTLEHGVQYAGSTVIMKVKEVDDAEGCARVCLALPSCTHFAWSLKAAEGHGGEPEAPCTARTGQVARQENTRRRRAVPSLAPAARRTT